MCHFFLEKCPLLVFGWFQQDSLWKETPLSCFNLRRRQTSQSKERRATDQSKTNFYTKRSIFPLKAVLKSKNLQFTTNFYSNKLQGSLLLIEVALGMVCLYQVWFVYIRFGLSILGLQWKVFCSWVILWWLLDVQHIWSCSSQKQKQKETWYCNEAVKRVMGSLCEIQFHTFRFPRDSQQPHSLLPCSASSSSSADLIFAA